MAKNGLTQFEVSFNGTTFLLDVAEGKMMSLNEIYAAAGSPANKEPWRWMDTEGAKQSIDSIMEILHREFHRMGREMERAKQEFMF